MFDQPSMNDNMIITLEENNEGELKELAKELLDKNVFVSWPHLTEAFVIAVSDKHNKMINTSIPGASSTQPNKGNFASMWMTMRNACSSQLVFYFHFTFTLEN